MRTLTYGEYLSLLDQLPRVRKWEQGQDPFDEAKNVSSNELAEKLIAGEIDVNEMLGNIQRALSRKGTSEKLTPEQKAREEKRLSELIHGPKGVVVGEKL